LERQKVTRRSEERVDCHLLPVEGRVVALAARQHGVVTTGQLNTLGPSRHWIAHRVKTGWLRRIHRGVYLLGPIEPPLAKAMAATLATGALLSHYPAAVLWSLLPGPATAMHVTLHGGNRKGPPGVTVHRVTHLHAQDASRHHGIPVTSPARTLLDLAATTSQRDLSRATNEAQVLRLVTDHSLDEQFRRYPTHRGTRALRQAIQPEPKLTRSEAECRLLELIRAAGLPEPETNARIAGHEADVLWRDQALVVEVDGYAFHSTRAAFERDRRRDAVLKAHGIDVIRVSWTQVTDEPIALVALLAQAYGQRSRGPR
jgi:very-short-patch-repair endonuclease